MRFMVILVIIILIVNNVYGKIILKEKFDMWKEVGFYYNGKNRFFVLLIFKVNLNISNVEWL